MVGAKLFVFAAASVAWKLAVTPVLLKVTASVLRRRRARAWVQTHGEDNLDLDLHVHRIVPGWRAVLPRYHGILVRQRDHTLTFVPLIGGAPETFGAADIVEVEPTTAEAHAAHLTVKRATGETLRFRCRTATCWFGVSAPPTPLPASQSPGLLPAANTVR